ncbi:apolipoprotein N-acyltransferase [Candidatus Koribacter versatilis Ellin345]|uniref:Apolipoprotein N-acyltransferase n=1 Tax=Koribacter versatilis (strain Ellin345) TaxID=204669 RepID=Q1II70_KORVE|nr:nitrilase-related carbon-nitrogen hydrolase [Candidatus Koribacter versatilis]ABF43430.1 apolipoprotein N-acyltransferase [Candidatus Koribacter versatilis Ellin345]
MDSRLRRVVLAAVAASGAMLFFASGVHPQWWLMWPAMVPVLAVAPRIRARWAFAAGFTSWAIGALNSWSYLAKVGVPVVVRVIAAVAPAIAFALALLLYRSYAVCGKPWRAALALASAWTAWEFLFSMMSIHGTFGNMAYTQMDFLPVLQLASVFGLWGVEFCLFLFAAAFALRTTEAGRRGKFVVAVILLAAAVLGFGAWRLNSGPSRSETVNVGLLASDFNGNNNPEGPDKQGRLLREYLVHADALIARGAEVVVIPEKISAVVQPLTGEIDARYQAEVDTTQAPIVVGVIRKEDGKLYNEARTYLPAQAHPVTYEKHHMLPPFESEMLLGTSRVVVNRATTWGVAICKDMDFPRLSREYGRDGVGLLLVPAWDFVVDGWLHDRMAVMRGVESGFSIARTAKNGLLTVTDDRGRVIAEAKSTDSEFASVLARVSVEHDRTIYAAWGDWWGWVCVLLTLALMAAALVWR